MLRPVAAVLLTLLVGLPGEGAAQEEPWDERFWNPEPDAADFVLPLPCGGSMAFRPVSTAVVAEDRLADRPVLFGTQDGDRAYSDYLRTEYLAGWHTEAGEAGTRLYYIGKYEVTDDQWAAVMGDECPRPGIRGRLPVADASWFDAVAFTRAYSDWLFENRLDALPQEDGTPAYVRLPTEAEWEFAARGGTMVDDGEFRADRFPMSEALDRYAWHQSPQSCDGDLQIVGRLLPNPLGLHDVLGNVQELVLEPFRMNRAGRPHGQVGGFVARGGSCRSDEIVLTSAQRVEYPYFSAAVQGELRPQFTGLRVVLSVPVVTSLSRLDDIREDLDEVLASRSEQPEDQTVLDRLDRLAGDVDNPDLLGSLEDIEAAIRSELALREEIEGRAVESAIQAGASLIRQYRDDIRSLDRLGIAARIADSDERRALTEQAIEDQKERIAITRRVYSAVLTQTSRDFSVATVGERLRVVTTGFEEGGADRMACFASVFAAQVVFVSLGQVSDYDVLMQDLVTECSG